jgi:hypothetical protein
MLILNMLKNHLIFGLVLILVVFLSGCLEGLTPEALAYANPLVQQFMSEYPNAQIQVTHFTALQSLRMLENMSIDCGKNITAKDMYRITINDPDGGLNVVVWIDWENKDLECAVKYGAGGGKTISKPGEPIQTCKSHAEAKCYGEHVYWFDSCGHKEEKKEYCQYGCELGFCKQKQEECQSHYEYKCYEGHVFWYDSCGNKEEKKEYCEHGCGNGECINETTNCTSHHEYRCYWGHVYWFDSCGFKEEKKEYCQYGCGNGECINETTNCTSHHEYRCHSGHVYWFDSCGHKEENKEYCEHGCGNGECVTCTSHHETKCYNDDVYWYDSCGSKEEIKEDCLYGCAEGACLEGTECVDFPCTIYAGDNKSVSYGGSTYYISLLGHMPALNKAVIKINGNLKEVGEGKTYTLSGFEFEVQNIIYRNSSSVLVAMGEDPQLTVHDKYATVDNGVLLSTDDRDLFVGDRINSARTQLAAGDLPNILKSDVFNDYYNNDYPYTQHIILGLSKIYDNYIDIGLLASQPVYTSKIVFTDPLNFSSPYVNYITEDMKLFGRNYIVMPGSTNDAVELFESYHPFSVNTDKNTTLSFEGDDFKFEMLGYTETEAVLRINGNDVMWEEGKIYSLPGSTVRVYVSDVTTVYYGANESVHSVFMNLGRLMSIENNEKAEVNYEDVSGTHVVIGKTGGKVSSISVSVAGQDSDKIYSGEDYKDPVWESFELAFNHPTTLKGSIKLQHV